MKLKDMYTKTDFPILLVGMHDYVEGATRLQKYAFLATMQVKNINTIGFYKDWRSSYYGPFSANLARDIDNAIKNGYIKRYAVTNAYGFKVDRFTLTVSGKDTLHHLQNTYEEFFGKIFKIVKPYQETPLLSLLSDVYYQYPKYTSASVIKKKIGKQIYESDTYLNPQYDEPDI